MKGHLHTKTTGHSIIRAKRWINNHEISQEDLATILGEQKVEPYPPSSFSAIENNSLTVIPPPSEQTLPEIPRIRGEKG